MNGAFVRRVARDPRRSRVGTSQPQKFGHLAEIGVVEEVSGRTAAEDDDLNLLVSAQLVDDLDQLSDGIRADEVHGRIREGDLADLRYPGRCQVEWGPSPVT